MDFLQLNHMQFHAYHGVFEQEKKIGNTYFIDLKIGADFTKACKSDQIEDTINYASVFHEIQEEMKNNCNLIEHLAENICQRLKSTFAEMQLIELKLTKQNPPLHGQLESVSIILTR
ncbi:MAG TPA: dihydroneopterin aldolase [Bacteroidales bacterium]|nr:dihydroneopterin aldolase [Bacteroidales bacterium]